MEVLSGGENSPGPGAIVRQWFEQVWNELDLTGIDQFMHDDCEILGMGNSVVGPSGFKKIHRQFTRAFDQIHVEVVDLVSDQEQAAGHARFAARHLVSGREVDLFFSFAAKFEAEKMIRVRNVVDYTSLMAQLNLLDPHRMALIFESAAD